MDASLELSVTSWQALKVPIGLVTVGSMTTQAVKTTFAARLNELLDEAGLPAKYEGRQLALAEMFGVSQKGARKWLEGEGLPTLERCIQIAERFGVNTEWLLTGRGPKRPGGSGEILADLPQEVRQESFDFLEFKFQKHLKGEQLARYLRWLDHMKKNPPGAKND